MFFRVFRGPTQNDSLVNILSQQFKRIKCVAPTNASLPQRDPGGSHPIEQQRREAIATIGQLANEPLERQDFFEAFEILHCAEKCAMQLLESTDATLRDQQTAILLIRNLALFEFRIDHQADANQRLDQIDQHLNRLDSQDRTTPEPSRQEWIASQRHELSQLRSARKK